jgi:hypothetical protein
VAHQGLAPGLQADGRQVSQGSKPTGAKGAQPAASSQEDACSFVAGGSRAFGWQVARAIHAHGSDASLCAAGERREQAAALVPLGRRQVSRVQHRCSVRPAAAWLCARTMEAQARGGGQCAATRLLGGVACVCAMCVMWWCHTRRATSGRLRLRVSWTMTRHETGSAQRWREAGQRLSFLCTVCEQRCDA